MHWQVLRREVAETLEAASSLDADRPIIFINSKQQRLLWVEPDDRSTHSYPISTAKKGLGNQVDSFQTPTGIHRIREKIGDGQPRGMIFRGREPTGELAENLDNREQDEIASRILWLDGLESGVNRDGDCDTFSRYIYIHGTSDEKRIGAPVSAGCVRMTNADVIELYDRVNVGDLVVIR